MEKCRWEDEAEMVCTHPHHIEKYLGYNGENCKGKANKNKGL